MPKLCLYLLLSFIISNVFCKDEILKQIPDEHILPPIEQIVDNIALELQKSAYQYLVQHIDATDSALYVPVTKQPIGLTLSSSRQIRAYNEGYQPNKFVYNLDFYWTNKEGDSLQVSFNPYIQTNTFVCEGFFRYDIHPLHFLNTKIQFENSTGKYVFSDSSIIKTYDLAWIYSKNKWVSVNCGSVQSILENINSKNICDSIPVLEKTVEIIIPPTSRDYGHNRSFEYLFFAQILKNGKVGIINVVHSDRPFFEGPFVIGLKQWKYKPALLNNKNTEKWVFIPFKVSYE